ncbi:acetyltransferase [Oxalobacteraceae bacterium GrIS 2.11]
MDKHYLSPLFSPKSIVVFAGCTAESEPATSQAQLVVENFKSGGFTGPLTYLDVKTSGTLGDLARSRVDLAIICLPDDQLVAALKVAGSIHCHSALIISGNVDAALASELEVIARSYGMYLLGPNCMGFQRPLQHLNASVLGSLAQPGATALVSQSAAVTSSVLDWASTNGVGFSAVVSLGAHTAVGVAQVLDFLAEDSATHSIAVYLEGIRDARRFMSALRAAAGAKPVIVLKAGHSLVGSKAAQTHTGAMIGSDDVIDAALKRAGAVRVRTFVQLFSAVKCLSSRYLPVGKRLAIISNGGGPAVMAADWVAELQLEVGKLSQADAASLRPKLSAQASIEDMIDLDESASATQYREAIAASLQSRDIDGILVLLSPRPGLDIAAISQVVADFQPNIGKPLITCWMGDELVEGGRRILKNAAIPTFRTPEAAVDAFNNIATFHQNQQLLRQVPSSLSELAKPDIEGARILIETILAERRNVLTEMESKALLSSFHIPVTRTILTRSASEAILVANQLGYPVALKVDSADIVHKSEVGGVALNIQNAAGVRDAWLDLTAKVGRLRPDAKINGVTVQNMSGKPDGRELYIGVKTDQQFGPAIVFGAGGTMIELIADRAIELPPLNQFLAHQLVDRVRSSETLGAWRGAPPADREALERILLRVSEMVCALPQLHEMDINPVIIDATGALVVDARIVVEPAPVGSLNYQHLAILPYPSDRESEWPMRNGSLYKIRPLHPHDAQMLQTLVRGLSQESRYFRFVSWMRELPERMLARFTLIDYDREMAMVAVFPERTPDPLGGFTETERIIGVSRYVTNPDKSTCEFSLLVADEFSGQGLGTRLMLAIIDVARSKGLGSIEGLVLTKNTAMLKLMKSLDFQVKPYEEDPDFRLCVRML